MTFQGLRGHLPEAEVRPVFGQAFGKGESFPYTLPRFLLFLGSCSRDPGRSLGVSLRSSRRATTAPGAWSNATRVIEPLLIQKF